MAGCVAWVKSLYPENLSIVFNITGKRDEKPLLELLAQLEPKHIFLTPNISTNDICLDQDNRNNPITMVRVKQAGLDIILFSKIFALVKYQRVCHQWEYQIQYALPFKTFSIINFPEMKF